MSAPFFKFSAVEWIAGAVQAVGFAERGIFVELCARTWMQGEPLKRGDKLAQAVNDGDRRAALTEAAHVAVVAIRAVEMLMEEEEE